MEEDKNSLDAVPIKAIRIQPSQAIYYFNRGITYSKMGKHKKAIDDFSGAIHYGSDEFKKEMLVFHFRGQEYTKIGDYEKAIDDFSESIRLRPDYIKSLLMRGNAFFGAGDKDKTKADFDEYLRRKRKDTDTARRKEISELFGTKPEDISLEIIK